MALGIKGRTVDLYVQFLDAAGERTNADDTPKVSITDADGTVLQTSSDSGVTLYDDPGIYRLSYEIPETAADGYASYTWTAKIGNTSVSTTLYFLISSSGSIESIDAPDYTPGDDIEFDFTEDEITGVNTLLKILKKRLKNTGTRKVPDGAGGYVDSTCNVFTDDELVCFLVNSLSEFNSTPHFSTYTFADVAVYGIFLDVIIQGANLLALAAQALIEKGREFTITDNGLSFQPPMVSEILNSQYTTQLAVYREKIKAIKCQLKPSALGLGTFRTTSMSPAYLRLRHLRSKQIV